MRTIIKNSIVMMLMVFAPLSANAETMSSSNYAFEADSINFAGNRSTSTSYVTEDTVGEVGTGFLDGIRYIFRGGYQQTPNTDAPPNSDIIPTPSSTPTSSSGGSGSRPGIVNPSNFIATPDGNRIILSWEHPLDPSFASVRLLRSETFFPVNPADGEVIYEGLDRMVVDLDVVTDRTYYYTIFARSFDGSYSSGVVASTRLSASYVPSRDPFAGVPRAPATPGIIKGLTLADFEFIQNGQNIVVVNDMLAIDGSKNLTIRLAYDKVPEDLKTIAITLADPQDSTNVFPFLLRVNKEKTWYEATIGALGKSGKYGISVAILNYENQGLTKINGNLQALVFALPEAIKQNYLPILYILIGILILLILLALLLRRKKNRSTLAQVGKAAAVILITFGLISTFIVGFIPSNVFAAVNKQINYQGKLLNASSETVNDGSYNLRFRLYTAASGGSPIWTETWCYSPDSGSTCNGSGTDSRIAVTSGLLSTMLGSITSLEGIDFNQTLYLSVEIGTSAATPTWDGEMTPRKKIGTIPAAFVADTLDNLDSAQFLRSDAQNSTSTTSTFISILQSGSGKIAEFFGQGSASVLSILSGGKVGIGTSTPYAQLSVEGASVLGNSATAGYFVGTTTATSTLSGGLRASYLDIFGTSATSTFARGIDLSGGCFAINGTCVSGSGGGGAVSSVSNSDGSLTISPTTGAVVASLNRANANVWTALQQFAAGASTTLISSYGPLYIGNTSTTTIFGDGATSTFSGGLTLSSGNINLPSTGNYLANNALVLNSTTLGSSVVNSSLTSVGALNSGSIASGFGSIDIGADALTAGAASFSSLSVSGASTFTGASTFNGLVQTQNASSTILSVYNGLYVGGSGTTTILGTATSTFGAGVQATYLNITGTSATSTFANGAIFTGGGLKLNTLLNCNAGSVLETDANGVVSCGLDAGAAGVVTSVANSDGSLTISPTTGDVVASLNRANANIWTALQQFAAGASSTRASVYETLYVGGSATTTIVGNNGTSTFASFISATAASTTATSTMAGINLPYGGCFAINGTCIGSGGSGSGTVNTGVSGFFAYYPSNGTTVDDQAVLNISGSNIGIGTSSPYAALSVVGASGVVANKFHATSTLATSTFAGGIIGPGGFIVESSSGNVDIPGTLGVNGFTRITDNLSIGNDADGVALAALDMSTINDEMIDGDAMYSNTSGDNKGFTINTTNSSDLTGNLTVTGDYHVSSRGGGAIGNNTLTHIGQEGTTLVDGGAGVTSGASANVFLYGLKGSNQVVDGGSLLGTWTVAGGYFPTFDNTLTGATTNIYSIFAEDTAYFKTKVGIGTTSPYAALSVVGASGVVADKFHATNTAATSTFAGFLSTTRASTTATSTMAGINLPYGGCFAVAGVCRGNVSGSGANTLLAFWNSSSNLSSDANLSYAASTLSAPGFATAGGEHILRSDGTAEFASSALTISASGDLATTGTLAGITLNTGQGANELYAMNQNVRSTDTVTFLGASTTVSSILDVLYVGRTASTTIRGDLGTSTFSSFISAAAASTTATSTMAGINLPYGGCFAVAGTCISGGGSGSVNSGLSGYFAYYPSDGTVVDDQSTLRLSGSNIAIGTSTPYSKLSVWGAGTGSARLFELTNSASTTLMHVLENGTVYLKGNLGIGTTSPYAALSVVGASGVVADKYYATSTTATSTFAGNVYVGGTTVLDSVQLGNLSFDTDAGTVAWMNLPISTNAPNNTVESYSALIDDLSVLTIYSQADGSGRAKNVAVGIGTTSPSHQLDILAGSTTPHTTGKTANYYGINIHNQATSSTASVTKAGINISSTGTWTGSASNNIGLLVSSVTGGTNNYDAIFNGGGNVGIGTTSPYAKLSVVGEVVARNFHATSTTATSTFAGGLNVGSGNINYDFSTGITSISSLQTGAFNFDDDAGVVNWVDLNITSSAVADLVQSYTANIDGNPLLTMYSQSDGQGRAKNLGIGIGTTTVTHQLEILAGSTTPHTTGKTANYAGIYLDNQATSSTASITKTGLTIRSTGSWSGTGANNIGLLVQSVTGGTNNYDAVFNGGGNVGVGTSSPWRKLSVNGKAAFTGLTNDGTGYYVCLNNTTYDLATSSTACGASSERFKTNINTLAYGLNEVRRLNPVSFNWKESFMATSSRQIGFIAEDVANVIPEVIGRDSKGQIMNLDYPKLTAVLVGAIKELDNKVAMLASSTISNSASSTDSGGSGSDEGGVIGSITAFFDSVGVKLTSGLASFKKVVADTLTIGSKEKPTGIVLYDADGLPYCLSLLRGGAATTTPLDQDGECLPQVAAAGDDDVNNEDEGPIVIIKDESDNNDPDDQNEPNPLPPAATSTDPIIPVATSTDPVIEIDDTATSTEPVINDSEDSNDQNPEPAETADGGSGSDSKVEGPGETPDNGSAAADTALAANES